MVIDQSWPGGSGGTLATHLITKLLAQSREFDITVITGTKNPAKANNVRFIKASNKVELLLRIVNPAVLQ